MEATHVVCASRTLMGSSFMEVEISLTATELRDLHERLLQYVESSGESFIRVRGVGGGTFQIVRIDKVDDQIFDLQRSPEFISLAKRSVGHEVVPLKVDCLYLSERVGELFLQQQISFAGHFDGEQAVSLVLPVGMHQSSLSVIRQAERQLLPSLRSADEALVCVDNISVPRCSISAKPGLLSVLDPWEVLCCRSFREDQPDTLLVFSYRSSRYLDAVRKITP